MIAEGCNSFLIHGGGIANINCPEGSSVQGDVAFVAVKNRNTTISGNWTIDGFDNLGSSAKDLRQGLFYGGNLSTVQFNLQREIMIPTNRSIYVRTLSLGQFC